MTGRGIANQYDFDPLGSSREYRRLDVHHRAQAIGRAVMLVERHAVEAEFLAVDLVVDVLVEEPGALRRVEILVGESEEAALFDNFVFGDWIIAALGEKHQLH